MFELKNYQKESLATLEAFLRRARIATPREAFEALMRERGTPTPYRHHGFEKVPYVCLRLPTGGGKTLLASHAVRLVAQRYLERAFPVTLWLVPSNAIRQQTVAALKQPGHPYRAELERAFDGRVTVLDIDEVTQIRPQDLGSRAVVVVSTLQNLRVSDTSGRRVYAYNEAFEPHFERLPPSREAALERVEEGDLRENGLDRGQLGRIKYSFANLLAWHNPLVIVDEAHNARTPLTFETLQRLHPACIVEFTATPDTSADHGSNLLHHVSAAELRAEEMIKLPIELTEHRDDWRAAVHASVARRARLAEEAARERDYLRPIALFQAEPKNGRVTVEVLRDHLIAAEGIDPARIAVATGGQRELEGIDLFDPACPIDFIITIEALKEGWDCSFAYVFCSVRALTSNRDVEQLLGRVLRMPYARRRQGEALNRAYAHVVEPDFTRAARALTDKLVSTLGFDPQEAARFLRSAPDEGEGAEAPQPECVLTLPGDPDFSGLDPAESAGVRLEADGQEVRATLSGEVSEALEERLLAGFKGRALRERGEEAREALRDHNLRQRIARAPSERGEQFPPVPLLCALVQGEAEPLEPESFFWAGEWSLSDADPELDDFHLVERASTFVVDLQGHKLTYSLAGTEALRDPGGATPTLTDLVRWLDAQVRDIHTGQEARLTYLYRVVAALTEGRGFTLATLSRARFPLAEAIRGRLTALRLAAARRGQQVLLADGPPLVWDDRFAVHFRADADPARAPCYDGPHRFARHFYPQIGRLPATGPLFACARALDDHPRLRHWVRNLAGRDGAGFRLPLPEGWFHPEFVAELEDGRLLVVACATGAGTGVEERAGMGRRWAEASGGRGLFLMTSAVEGALLAELERLLA